MSLLSVAASKILGWFKNQRTAVGKLLKKKSGQASQPLTTRSRWQLSSFQFLQQYIKPRTYQHDTGVGVLLNCMLTSVMMPGPLFIKIAETKFYLNS